MQSSPSVTVAEIAAQYGVSAKTFSLWLKEARIQHEGKRLMPATVCKIHECLGHPQWSATIKPPLRMVKASYTRLELAQLYDLSRDAFYRRCQNAGIFLREGRLPPKEIMRVFEAFGVPNAALPPDYKI